MKNMKLRSVELSWQLDKTFTCNIGIKIKDPLLIQFAVF